MPFFKVDGYETTLNWVCVEADNEAEAIQKAWDGDVIEGTQDTDPGKNMWKSKWSAVQVEEHIKQTGFGRGQKTYY